MQQLRISTADAAAIAATLAMSAAAMGDIEPDNDSFFFGEAIPLGPNGGIFGGELEDRGCGYGYGYLAALKTGDGGLEGFGYCSNPDTILRTLDSVGGNELDFDDDGSPVGDGLASALFGQQLGAIDIGGGFLDVGAVFQVSGCCDGFSSPQHFQFGEYSGTVFFLDIDGNVITTEFFGNFWFNGDEVDTYEFLAPTGAVAYDIVIDNDFCAPDNCEVPDTTLGVFDSVGNLVATNDDGSPFGNGLASAIFGADTGPTNTAYYAISGFDDFDFDGIGDFYGTRPHGQLGSIEAFIDWRDGNGDIISSDFVTFETFFSGIEVFTGAIAGPAGASAYDLFINNVPEFGNCVCRADVDFYTISALTPGAIYDIRTANSFADTVLAVLDDAGNVIGFNDDDPDFGCCLSALRAQADANGEIRIAVSGFFDEFLVGAHGQTDLYDVEVTPASPGCNLADVAEPFGTLDIDDVLTYLNAFADQSLTGDVAPPFGVFDIDDVLTFLNAFATGCP